MTPVQAARLDQLKAKTVNQGESYTNESSTQSCSMSAGKKRVCKATPYLDK